MLKCIFSIIEGLSKTERLEKKGSYLFHRGDLIQSIFIIRDGRVDLTRFQEGGRVLVLQRAGANTFIAEASVYSENYHCDAVVMETSVIQEYSRHAFLKKLSENSKAAELWASHLAKEVQSARYRSEILTGKTVSERLNGWMTWKGDVLPPKGQWKSVAEQIGVSPEALYRELAKRSKPID